MDPQPRERRFELAGALVGLLALLFFFVPVVPPSEAPRGEGRGAPEAASEAAPAPAPAPARPRRPAASLRGEITLPGGEPASGARVRVLGGGLLGFVEVTADDDGRFVVPTLPPGFYEVQAYRGRFVAHAARGVHVRPNESADLTLSMVPGVAIDGRVVSARTGEGIGDAEVRISGELLDIASRVVQTKGDGTFTVPGLTPGPKVVRVHKDGFVQNDPLQVDPGEGEILVRLGTEARLDVTVLDPRGRPVRDAEAQLLVEGELEGRGRSPRPADRLLVVPGPVPPIPVSGSAPDARRSILASGSSDDDGRIHLRGLRAADVRIRLSAEGRPTVVGAPIELRPGRTSEARMTLPYGGTLKVRVFDADEVRAENVTLHVRLEDDPIGAYARTDDNGEAEIAGVRGALVIRASRGASPPTVQRARIEEGEVETVDVVLGEARDELSGRVVDARGFGISGASLHLESLRERAPFRATTRSERDGTFRFGEIPRPPHRVVVEHPAYADSDPLRVDSLDAPLTVTLDPGGAVAGEILDRRTREPVAAPLVFRSGERTLSRRAWSDGTFEFEHLPLGAWTLRIDDERYVPFETSFELEPGGRRPPKADLGRIELVAGASVTGEVVDAVGEPIYGARVAVGEGSRTEARTDEGGRFSVTRIAPGRHRVVARLRSGERIESDLFSLREGEVREGIRLAARSRAEATDVPTTESPRVGIPITVTDSGGAVVIDWIAPDASAARRALRVGDRVVAVDGNEVMIAAQARALLRGERRTLRIRRGDRTREITLSPERFTPP